MKALRYPLLLDENVNPVVLGALREEGRDVVGIKELGLGGQSDEIVLAEAHRLGRVVLTHDRDFGTLAIRGCQPYVGIIYIRPGHIEPRVVARMLAVLDTTAGDLEPPFVVVVEHRSDRIRVRLRRVN